MRSRYWQILKAWALRPLSWVVLFTAVVVLLSCTSRSSIYFTDAFENARSRRPAETLHASDEYRRDLELQQRNSKVEGLDLTAMDSVERNGQMELQEFHEIEAGIANYPNTEWIYFGDNQLSRIRPGTLGKVPNVTTAVVPGKLSDRDIDRLLELRNLEHLTILSNAASGSLARLADLPKLESLVFIGEQRNFPEQDSERIYGPERFRELGQLPHLKSLTLAPPWFPQLVFHPDTPPNSSMAPMLTSEMLESLKQFPSLKLLSLGAAQRQEQSADLQRIGSALPNVSVRPARYSDRIVMRAVMTIGFGFGFLIFLHVFGLAAVFSSPQSVVIPNHQSVHLRFAIGSCLVAAIVFAWAASFWSSLTFFSALVLALLALIYVLWVCRLLTFARTTSFARGSLVFVGLGPMALLLGVSGLTMFAPQVMVWLEQFLLGHNTALSLGLVVPATIIAVCQFTGYRSNYIVNAEAGMNPIVTVQDFGAETTSQAMLHQEARLETVAARWKNAAAKVQRLPAGWYRALRLLALGDVAWDSKKLFGLPIIGTLLLLAVSSVVPIPFPYALMAAYGTTALMIGVSLTGYSRRNVLSQEFLRPRSRRTFVQQYFGLVLIRTCCAGALAVGCTLAVRVIQGPPINLQSLLLCALGLVGCTLLFAGLGLWGVLLRKVWLATPAAILILVGVCAMCWLLTDGQPFFPRSTPVRGLVYYAGVYSLPLLVIAILTITSAYWKWLRVEFDMR